MTLKPVRHYVAMASSESLCGISCDSGIVYSLTEIGVDCPDCLAKLDYRRAKPKPEAQVVYKLRHKPTGLFYQPIKGNYNQRTNLGAHGKVYLTGKPCCFAGVTVHEKQVKKYKLTAELLCYRHGYRLVVAPDEWEVVSFELKEIGKA